MKIKKLSKREQVAIFLFRKCFQNGYREYVSAYTIAERVHKILVSNKRLLSKLYPKTVGIPLNKINDNEVHSRRHIVSFLRALAKLFKNRLVYEKRCLWVNKAVKTVYYYRLVRLN